MKMVERFVYLDFQIDTNRINSKFSLPYMNKLEQWDRDDVIHIQISEIAQSEALQGNNVARRSKARRYVASETLAHTREEIKTLRDIEHILFPSSAKTQNERNDVEVVFNAHKYMCILITNDGSSKKQPGGILGHATELKQRFRVEVMRDYEAVALVEKKIKERDVLAKKFALALSQPLPEWVGKD